MVRVNAVKNTATSTWKNVNIKLEQFHIEIKELYIYYFKNITEQSAGFYKHGNVPYSKFV
jgi:hypothetical protein